MPVQLQRRRGPRVLDHELDSAMPSSWFLFLRATGVRLVAPAWPSVHLRTGMRLVAPAWPSENETTNLHMYTYVRMYTHTPHVIDLGRIICMHTRREEFESPRS